MVTLVRNNERSHAIDLISVINSLTSRYSLQIKKAGGEKTISMRTAKDSLVIKEDMINYGSDVLIKNSIMFPDVVLYGDSYQTDILQGWELKLPDVLITDETFINDAKRKAIALGLNSFFIWNFTAGVLYIKNDSGAFEIAKQWNRTNHIRTRMDVEEYRDDWEKEINEILLEINEYLVNGIIRGTSLGEIISDTVVSNLVSRNKEIVANELKKQSTINTVVEAYLDQWWKEFEKEYSKDEKNKFVAYSKIIILNWTSRIIFANLIKKYHNDAREVSKLHIDMSIEEAEGIFGEITKKCDFYSVFAGVLFNEYIPRKTWSEIIELNEFLVENGIEEVEQSSLQTILENTVSTTKREISGQYTTPTKLAEIFVKMTMTNLKGNIIDPCCGTGSIPKEALQYKKNKINFNEAVCTTWASDKYEYPLQVANISLTSPDSINIPNRVFKYNALSLSECQEINIVNPIDGVLMNLKLPLFDTIISNLPFIPFEIIDSSDKEMINKIIKEVNEKTGYRLSKKSDIYCFIMFSLHKLLKENGRAGFITSNSWLGTIWGKDFYKALNYYFNIEQIHISGKGRWFNNAKVVTTIIILSHKSLIEVPNPADETVFYLWKKSLNEIAIDNVMKDTIINSSLLKKNLDENSINMSGYKYEEIEDLLELNISLNSLFHNVEWLKELQHLLVPLKDVFNVVRGERRGWDPMFYPQENHNIDEKYIKRVLKNARKVETLIAEADNDAFCCGDSINELEQNEMYGTIQWIRKFENGTNKVGAPLIKSLARKKMHWYEMNDGLTVDIMTMMNPGKRLFFARFRESTFINQRLIGLRKKDDSVDIELNHALLNSVLGMFFIEAVGFGKGLGALDMNRELISNIYIMDSNRVSIKDRELILDKFDSLLKRKIKSTFEEMNSEDRIDFDKTILKVFGIENYYDRISKSLLSMQQARLSVKQQK